jgi:MFS family permease
MEAASAPFHALLPDLVPEKQQGTASGLMGIGQMIGSILGVAVPGIVIGLNAGSVIKGQISLGQYNQVLYLCYGVTAAVILTLAIITVTTVKERPPEERVIDVKLAL